MRSTFTEILQCNIYKTDQNQARYSFLYWNGMDMREKLLQNSCFLFAIRLTHTHTRKRETHTETLTYNNYFSNVEKYLFKNERTKKKTRNDIVTCKDVIGGENQKNIQ